MIASASPTNRIARRDLEQFRQSIESWERHGREAGRDGDAELAVLAVLKAASAPTIRAPSAEWKGPRFQQDLTGWAVATEV